MDMIISFGIFLIAIALGYGICFVIDKITKG